MFSLLVVLRVHIHLQPNHTIKPNHAPNPSPFTYVSAMT